MTTNPNHKPAAQMYCATCEQTFASGDRCPDDGTRLVRIKTHTDPLLGRELDGRYTIAEKLGQGGMGSVYRATQHTVGRDVAVKVVNPALISDPDVIKRFLREAKLASRLSHPNAVNVLEFGQTDDGLLYLVMELVTGRTLDHVIKTERTFTPERIVHIGAQVCDALEGAHALKIVHRDMKPANIMLLAQGRDLVKVLDFGLAKSIAPDQTSTTMTNAGGILGTPAYMPPELALGQPCDGRADLYSLGCVLFLLGAGRLPFVSDNAHELIAMHGTEAAPPMMGVPPALAAVIDRMLEKDPARRYQTAAENREALEAALVADRALVAPHSDSGDMPVATALGMGPDQALATEIGVGPFPHTVPQFAPMKTEISAPRPTDDPLSRLPSPAEVSKQRRAVGVSQVSAAVEDSQVPAPIQVSYAPTMLATDIVPVVRAPSSMQNAPRSKRGHLVVLALVVLAAGGAAAFFAMRSSSSSSRPPAAEPSVAPAAAAPSPAPATTPSPAPATTPSPAPATTPSPAAAATPSPAPAQPAAAETTPPAITTPPQAATPSPAPEPTPEATPPPSEPKPTHKPKPTTTTKPKSPTATTTKPPSPPTGAGSGKQPALPF